MSTNPGIDPPHAPAPTAGEVRRVRPSGELVWSVSGVLLATTVLSLTMLPFAWDVLPQPFTVLCLFGFVSLYASCMWLAKHGQVVWGAHLFLFGTFLGQIGILLSTVGLENQALITLINLTLASGFMLGRRMALLWSVVGVFTVVAQFLLVSAGWWPEPFYQAQAIVEITSVAATAIATGGLTFLGVRHMNRALVDAEDSRAESERALRTVEKVLSDQARRARRAERLSVMARSLVELRQPAAIAVEVAVGVHDALDATVTGIVGRNGRTLSVVGLGAEPPAVLGQGSEWGQVPEGGHKVIPRQMLAQLGRELGIDSPETGLVARGPRSGLLLFVLGPNEWLGASDVAWSLSTAVSLLAAAIHRSEAEQTLAQGQKMGALGRLSAGIAHDFNNLLTTILGGTELVEHKMQADPAMRAHLRGIREAGERAASLTSKLMTFTLASPREPKPVEVGGVVHDLIPVIRRSMEESIEITFDLPDEELWIDADSIDVERVVLNLMANSRDAMGLNGRVDLGVEAREDAQVGEQVVIWVQDDGEGMDRPTRAQVFEPFFSTRRGKGATGLGLSIVYGLVQGLGGEIYVDSAPGKGSCFEVVLPRQMDPILPEERTQSAIQSGAGKAVLLVEDDPDVRDIVCEMLRLGGFEVVVADGGENALGILSERTGFSLVLTDVVMPSMSGFDLAEQIQEQELDVPIALISGYAAGGRAGAAGAEMSLPRIAKPFSLDELLGFVHRQLR